jgi:predicted nucleotidyltransferase component of viral defense system
MIIPLEKRLRKRMHVEIALLQDEAVEILYGIENGLVFHGGTALWRCYGGNRFSEDLDFYCRDIGKIEREFRKKAAERGLAVLKFKKTANLVFCKVSNGRAEIRVELNHSARKAAIVRSYEKADGSFMDVLTLAPEDLLLEKIDAYRNRRFIRDIYDVYHLSNYVKDEKMVKTSVLGLLESLEPPIDEENLKAIVYAGNIPSFGQIVEALKRRFS